MLSHAALMQEANAEEEAVRQAAMCSAMAATPAVHLAKHPQAGTTVFHTPATEVRPKSRPALPKLEDRTH